VQFLVGAKPWLAVKILSVVVPAATPVALARVQFFARTKLWLAVKILSLGCVVLYFRLR